MISRLYTTLPKTKHSFLCSAIISSFDTPEMMVMSVYYFYDSLAAAYLEYIYIHLNGFLNGKQ